MGVLYEELLPFCHLRMIVIYTKYYKLVHAPQENCGMIKWLRVPN